MALALALSFGSTAGMEAKQKPAVQRSKAMKKARKAPKTKRYKQSKAAKVKPRKAPKRRA